MTIPSQSSDDVDPKQPVKRTGMPKDRIDQASQETHARLLDETPQVGHSDSTDALPESLTPDERAQAVAALAFLSEVRTENRHADLPPATIGRYSIVKSIGRGGFAEVFLAEDEELDRRVALKVPLFNSATNEAARQRFEREAKLAASLGHPQIVPVYEYGDLGAVRFIAFAWCDGPNLADWITENGPVDFDTAARMVSSLAQAVQHAHQRGVVHRDLKPGNVLVDTSDDSAGKPIWERLRITDFGLARNFDSHDATLTQDGQLVGTPAYMAPEQAGSGEDVGPPADVWALGMMLFELLTGELPFRRPEIFATIRAICDESVPRSKKRRPDVPAGLDAITDLCLRKHPTDRFDSAHALAEDLGRWVNGEPIIAKPPSALSTFSLWTRRNPVLASLIGLTIASLTIGLGIALWQRNVAVANLLEAQSQTNRADGNLETAQKLINDIAGLERKLRQQKQLSKERITLIRRAAQLQIELVEDEEQTPKVRFDTAMSLRELSDMLFRLRDFEAALKNSERVLGLLDGLKEPLPEGVPAKQIFIARIEQRIKMAGPLIEMGKEDEAFALYRANELEEPPESIHPIVVATYRAENLRAQSLLHQKNGNLKDSTIAIGRALEAMEGLKPSEDKRQIWNVNLTVARLNLSLGIDETTLGDFDAAETTFLRVNEKLASLKELFPNHQMIPQLEGMTTFHLGALYERTEEWASAVEQYNRCRTIQLAMFEQNQAFTIPANTYIVASLALARSHDRNDSPESCLQIAQETFERADTFPDSLKADQAFKDNMSELKKFLP